jgi:hypothetical protein
MSIVYLEDSNSPPVAAVEVHFEYLQCRPTFYTHNVDPEDDYCVLRRQS